MMYGKGKKLISIKLLFEIENGIANKSKINKKKNLLIYSAFFSFSNLLSSLLDLKCIDFLEEMLIF